MIDPTIVKELEKRHGKYDFNALISFMESTGFTYQNKGLIGPMGFTTIYSIMFDMNVLSRLNDKLLYFVVLHETAHMKRIKKVGNKNVIKGLSIEPFDVFHSFLINEEIVADRYACSMFRKLNSKSYPWYETQQLNLPFMQDRYAGVSRQFYGKIKNKKKNYDEWFKKFIVE